MVDSQASHADERRAQAEAYERQPVGAELARAVAQKLKTGAHILNCHRDYCGHALAYLNNAYAILEVNDGNLEWGELVISFTEESAFIAYLANQSNLSLSGCDESAKELYVSDVFRQNNQRLTRGILEQFVGE